MSQTFEDVVETSVREAMSKMLGGEVWRAVTFYFDVKLVAREPESFARLLDKLFRNSSRVLQQIIGETLVSKAGVQVDSRKQREFQDWVQIARAKFSTLHLTPRQP